MDKDVTIGQLVGWIFGGLLGLTLLFGSWVVINPGQVGVVIRLGSVGSTLGQGFHFKLPLIDSVEKTDIQTQKEQTEADAASADLQNVQATIAVNWNVQPEKVADLYIKVGNGFGEKIIDPAIQEVVKAVTAKYTAEQLITKRPQVTEDIQTGLSQRLAINDILVTGVSIVNFQFSKTFNEAIEAKVTAEQNALAEKNNLEAVKFKADQRVAQAQGEAAAIKAQSEAVQQGGGADYVKLQAIKQWDGHLPTYMTSGAAMPFLDLNK